MSKPKRHFTFYISDEMKADILRLAKEKYLPRAEIIRIAIEEFLDREKKKVRNESKAI